MLVKFYETMKQVKILNVNLTKLSLIWVFIVSVPLFTLALFFYRFSPKMQFIVFMTAALLYLAAALLHHFKEKSLTLEVIIEYILIAALALIILQGLII